METRSNPKEGKLLYHLTTMDNIKNIIEKGLLPRSELTKRSETFKDTANSEILSRRKEQSLDEYVPFHFFVKNPYDGRQFRDHPDIKFVYISITREFLKTNNGVIIPKHPLSEANHTLETMPYSHGFDAIDWDLVAKRDYLDQECKRACMCEALHKGVVPSENFNSIVVKTKEDYNLIDQLIKQFSLKCHLNQNEKWFI